MTRSILVWHRDDLRTVDNAALAAAVADGDPAPAFVFDPRYYGERSLACDARLRFLHECLDDLDRQYRDRGSSLALRTGDPREVLWSLLDSGVVDAVYCNRSTTARYGREVGEAVRSWDAVTTFSDDGIRRTDRRHRDGTVAVDTREGWGNGSETAGRWQDHCEAYFEREPAERPAGLPDNPVESTTSVEAVEDRYDVTPEKSDVPPGGTVAGKERLSAFCDRLSEYPGVVSPPAAAAERSSRLSPYLAFGPLSVRQVYRAVEEAPECRGRSMYRSRLFWNRHYSQKLADWPGWADRAVNPVLRGLFRDEHDPELVAAWTEGRTGFPMVDAAMRALVETGYINFRTRAMVASFFHYVLREWWRRGADFMYRHLIDADPAINYTQWQSQCNLTGVHPVRIYDPAKQVREYDSDGEFVREYVPELAPLPDEHLAKPGKAPLAVQEEAGVRIGEDYPRPVVDFERRAAQTRAQYADLADRAEEALSDARVRRRGSFSTRRREEGEGAGEGNTGEATSEGQSSLDDF
ncbi:deoxyribodipyrimidine photolyase [Halosimplex carlsbadense 2-9-1]|uniref:Deoxyribodipyrimidine photolyase n=1 Tax=Halosimplex carlsbadense 2-9-1 TaxID=797114 RepID=M0CG81_9EURY|nr:FAD-binding domain-containing protein [Halosimplex carlsbadense]ELZ22261.1 deoxyribodipyrimidine photolyase [Halosimplex carlsbadense 2-9-1]